MTVSDQTRLDQEAISERTLHPRADAADVASPADVPIEPVDLAGAPTIARAVVSALADEFHPADEFARSRDRRVFYIDVGDMTKAEAKEHTDALLARYRTVKEFTNESGLAFTDISSELWREYEFADGTVVRIEEPLKLNVSRNGHRLFSADGVSHYVPGGWRHLRWKGLPNFVK